MDALVSIGKVIAGFLGVLLVMSAPFAVVNLVADIRQKRRIRTRFLALGIPISKIEGHKNHYGVSFAHAGTDFYVRCVPGSDGFRWIHDTPDFLVQPNDTVRSK